jgi:hypothetical protein
MGNELLASISQSTDLAKVVSKASDDVTTLEPWEILMLDSFFMRGLNSWELTLEQLETGALNAPKESVYEVFGRSLDQPWVTEVWDRTRIGYPKGFQKLVDRQLEENKSVST